MILRAALFALLLLAGLPARADVDGGGEPLFVELVINGVEKGALVPLRLIDGRQIVSTHDLTANGLRVEGANEIDLSAAPGIKARYDAPGQRLLIDASPDLLPLNRIGPPVRDRINGAADPGAMLNYDLYVQRAAGRSTAALWTEQRLFGPVGDLSNTGTLRIGARRGPAYLRYDTSFHAVDQDRAVAFTAGDLITRSFNWTSSVRIGGIQIGREFRIRPDLLTMPLPSFAGQTAVPSAVDLFVNGFRQQRAEVTPGRFVLDDMPVVNGAGEATIVTTDAVGRQIATTIPFYVAAELLRPGLIDGSVEAGWLRRGYGLRNFGYGAMAASGSIRAGITQRITVEGHGEATRGLAMAGAGILFQPGRLGVIDLSIGASRRAAGSGGQISIGYSYTGRAFSIAAQHLERSRDYRDLGTFDLSRQFGTRRQDRVVASLAVSSLGTLGAAYVGGRTSKGRETHVGTLSFSRSLAGGASLFAGIDRDFRRGSTSARINLLMPFGRGYIGGGVSRDPGRGLVGKVDYQRPVPLSGGLGVTANLAGAADGDTYGQTSVRWRGRSIALQGGGAFAGGRTSLWAGATGAIVHMDGATFATNQVSDAFALISTDRVADVPITYENQMIGRTDRRGHLFVPNVNAWHPSRFAIDPLSLAEDLSATIVEKRVAVRAGVGAVVHMPLRRNRSVTIALVDMQGQPLAAGGTAHRGNAAGGMIGWDGLLFLENAAPIETLAITRADGGHCRATVHLPASLRTLETLGPVICVASGGLIASRD